MAGEDLVQTPSPQAESLSGHPIASDGGEAVFGWLPHYSDPLHVLTWKLSEAFGATFSERQWLAARELLEQFAPRVEAINIASVLGDPFGEPQVTVPETQQEFEPESLQNHPTAPKPDSATGVAPTSEQRPSAPPMAAERGKE